MSNHSYDMMGNMTSTCITNVLRQYPMTYYFVPIYAMLFLIGTFGNGLVIISVVRSCRLHTVTNTYLLNIAIADFLLLLSIPFLIVTIFANGWIFGHILCKMYYNFIHINQYVSSLLLAALSFDRYLAVCRPIQAIRFRTKTKCALIIAGCWLISVLFLCPTWVFATVTYDKYVVWHGFQVQKCVIDFPSLIFTIPPEIVFTYYAFLLGFLFPITMITTFYILVLIRLHHIRRKHRSEFKERSHRKVTRIVLAVITAYFICWVPYWLLQIFITIDPLLYSLRSNAAILFNTKSLRFLKELTHLTTIIGYANNCLNPLLYVFLSDSFREEYILVLNCFNSHGANQARRTSEENSRAGERPLKSKNRKPVLFKTSKDAAMKKIKHSVAIDEMTTDSRKFSLFSSPSNEQHRPSSSSISSQSKKPNPQKIRNSINSRESFLLHQGRGSTFAAVRHSLIHNNTKNNHYQTTTFLDDGGVYCGE